MATRFLYFDCFSGIAGDMTLGAHIDLGVDVDDLRSALQTLPVDGWTLDTSIARKSGLRGVDVQIRIGGESEGPAALDEDGLTGPDHGHGHSDAEHQPGTHDPDDHSHAGHRHYRDIVEIIREGSCRNRLSREPWLRLTKLLAPRPAFMA